MSKYFIVTVDTEADWFHQKENRLNNIQRIHSFQKICKYYKISPTYLTNYEVINNKDAVDVLKIYHKKDMCEIGSHLHILILPKIPSAEVSKYYPPLNIYTFIKAELKFQKIKKSIFKIDLIKRKL